MRLPLKFRRSQFYRRVLQRNQHIDGVRGQSLTPDGKQWYSVLVVGLVGGSRPAKSADAGRPLVRRTKSLSTMPFKMAWFFQKGGSSLPPRPCADPNNSDQIARPCVLCIARRPR
jgi:hypothetical protein